MSNSLIDRRLMLLKSFCNFKVTVKSRLEKALIVCQLSFVLFSVSGIAFVPFISITFLPAGTNCMDKTGAESTVRKKMATGYVTENVLFTKTLKERIKRQRKFVSLERLPLNPIFQNAQWA